MDAGPCGMAPHEAHGSGAPLRHQRLPLRPCGDEVAFLDVAEATNLLRDAGDVARQRQLVDAQLAQQLIDAGPVLGDQPPLDAALGGVAERIDSVPRSRFRRASTCIAPRIQGPKAIFTGAPLAPRRDSMGGAMWCTSL